MASLIEMLTGGNKFDLYRKKAENPTAHENIDKLILNNELNPEIQEVIQTAIMGGVGGPAGSLKGLTQLIKSKGGVEILKRLKPKTKDVKTFIESMNKKSLENLKAINKEIKKEATTNLPLYSKTPAASKWNIEKVKKTKDVRNEIENNLATILGIFAPIIASVTAKKANEEYNLSGNIAKMLRPDPVMPTKQQNNEDMNLMKMLMSPEAQLKYLKNTGQGYPADEEMFLRAEPENTNEILLQLLGE